MEEGEIPRLCTISLFVTALKCMANITVPSVQFNFFEDRRIN